MSSSPPYTVALPVTVSSMGTVYLGVALSSTADSNSGSGFATAVLADIGNGGGLEDVARGTARAGNAPLNRPDPNSTGNLNTLGRVEEFEPRGGQPIDKHLKPTELSAVFTHMRSPSGRVLNSIDILPLILESLKASLAENKDWKAAFASILHVNRAFFQAGVGPLWHTMTSIGPALKLLPWHGTSKYKGLGTYPYTGSPVDWGRFLLYTPLMRELELELQPGVDDVLDLHWVRELLYLPARPVLFPYITRIAISPEVLASLPLLPLIVGTPLQSLAIAACDDDDWHEEAVDDRLQANFPFIHCAAPYLRSFKYRGPAGPGFFHRLTLLKSITTLDLEWVNPIKSSDLMCISDLPELRTLHLTSSEPISVPPQAHWRSPEGALGWPALRAIKITGVEMMQGILTRYQHQHAQVENVHLVMTRVDKPALVQATLAFYLRFYVTLESIRMLVVPQREQQDPWPQAASIGLIPGNSDLDIEEEARRCFASASNIRTATFEGIPHSLCRFVSSVLQNSISGWKRLTSLTFGVQPIPLEAESMFPGLSFLAETIWLECPYLEFLGFRFDRAKVMDEGLSGAVDRMKRRASGIPSAHPHGHPLQVLIIDTGTRTDDSIGSSFFSPDRKIEIVTFLEQLFPRLRSDSLCGMPGELWGDMGSWLHTYRKLKVKAATTAH